MPYASDAQRRFFHTDTARKKGISAATVKEFDNASRGRDLPERASSHEHVHGAAMRGLKHAMGRRGH